MWYGYREDEIDRLIVNISRRTPDRNETSHRRFRYPANLEFDAAPPRRSRTKGILHHLRPYLVSILDRLLGSGRMLVVLSVCSPLRIGWAFGQNQCRRPSTLDSYNGCLLCERHVFSSYCVDPFLAGVFPASSCHPLSCAGARSRLLLMEAVSRSNQRRLH